MNHPQLALLLLILVAAAIAGAKCVWLLRDIERRRAEPTPPPVVLNRVDCHNCRSRAIHTRPDGSGYCEDCSVSWPAGGPTGRYTILPPKPPPACANPNCSSNTLILTPGVCCPLCGR